MNFSRIFFLLIISGIACANPVAEMMSETDHYYKLIRKNQDASWEDKLLWAEKMTAEFEKGASLPLPKFVKEKKAQVQYKILTFETITLMHSLQLAAVLKDKRAYASTFKKIKKLKAKAHEKFEL